MKKLVIGILAHVDAGKTTLSEALLYSTGQIRKLGRVDHKDTFLDTDSQEKERGITIFSKQAKISSDSLQVTLLDTPGHVDFSAEMERALWAMDYAVLVISGTDGVQSHTRTLWRLLKHYEVPTFIFVNKMDLAGADQQRVLTQLQSELDQGCVDFSSAPEQGHELLTDETFCDALAMCNEEMMEYFLEKAQLPIEMVQRAVKNRQVYPCFLGSALKLSGVENLWHGLEVYAKEPEREAEFGARVYKIGRDAQGNRLTHLKVTGGALKVKESVEYAPGKSLANQPQDLKQELREKVDQLRIYSGDKFEVVDQVTAGEVCAVTGLTQTLPGIALGLEKSLEMPVLTPVLNYQMLLPSETNPSDMLMKMRQLEEEDPELHILWKEDLKEIHVQLMGQVQIEVLTHLIRERFGVAVEFGQGSIVYKETIAKPVEGVGHFEPLRHYAEVHLLMEPGEPGSGIQIASGCSEDDLDLNWQRLIFTHIEEREHVGVLTGSGLTDVKFTLLNGRAHIKHTEGGDFRQATYRAIRQGLKSTENVLLEPVYAFTLEVPSENVGRAMSDLKQRHGSFEAPEFVTTPMGERAVLKGIAPVSTMQDYMKEVHAYTKGLGQLVLELKGYDRCHNPQEIIEQMKYDSEADLANPTGSVFCAHGAGFLVPWNQVPDYMHLEYRYVPDLSSEKAQADGYRYETDGFAVAGASVGSVKKSQSSWELDQELQQIYAREFGMNKEDMLEYERKKWRKKNQADTPARGPKLDKQGNPIYPKKPKQEQHLIVDGYNVIFALEAYKSLAQMNMDSAKGKLLDDLVNYRGFKKCQVTVVFDAYKQKGHPESVEEYHGITVVHTKTDMTADTYIEQMAHRLGDSCNLTVATNDGLEQLTIMSQGALRMSAVALWEEMESLAQNAMTEYQKQQVEKGSQKVTLADYMKDL